MPTSRSRLRRSWTGAAGPRRPWLRARLVVIVDDTALAPSLGSALRPYKRAGGSGRQQPLARWANEEGPRLGLPAECDRDHPEARPWPRAEYWLSMPPLASRTAGDDTGWRAAVGPARGPREPAGRRRTVWQTDGKEQAVTRIALVGAGYIAQVHAEALRSIPGMQIASIIDPSANAAAALAALCPGAEPFASVAAALAANAFDRAHVLVPPDLHAPIAAELLAAGKPVLVEKPLAATSIACTALLAQAAAGPTPLGVNQNFVHHPAFVRMRRLVDTRAVGRPRHVDVLYNVPLRQLAARQFGHWMFAKPANILLEQAVHPLSQIATLAGPIGDLRAIAALPVALTPDRLFHAGVDVVLACEHLPAQLRFAVGQSFPFWQIRVVCDDGVIVADILANRCVTHARTRWMDAVDGFLSGTRTAAALLRDSAGGTLAYAASLLHLRPRSDPFFVSMREAIAGFHAAVDAGQKPVLDAAFGAMLVDACERISDAAFAPAPALLPARPVANRGRPDIAILGGTGFIGAHLVRRCLADNMSVTVMARSVQGLPAVFADARVRVLRGDIRDPDAIARAIDGAPMVVNLAHGGGGKSFDAIRAAMVGGAETVARAVQVAGVGRLVHVGSIAALYLGPQAAPVTGATPPDPHADQRADYARAKALCDAALLALHRDAGLKLVIIRPGIVVGTGSLPFHSGLGMFNNEQHCIGWNAGRNPLPFVLVEDVADATLRACRSQGIDGRCYNLVGDVRWCAREYIATLAAALERPLRFHPQSATRLWLVECGKWGIKRLTGRAVAAPSRRDFLSRGMSASFDCSDAKRDLGWRPEADAVAFRARAIDVHGVGG
jgi:predicted dehydrogenase/nucleoside-diphosphate-sugar epimerase